MIIFFKRLFNLDLTQEQTHKVYQKLSKKLEKVKEERRKFVREHMNG